MTDSPSQLSQHPLRDDTLLIRSGTALDNTNAHQMLDAITVAQSKDFRFIILDLCDLQFLSSAGVGAIIGTVEAAREKGGDIILCNLAPGIRHVLEVLDLADYLTLAPDMSAAEAIRER